MQKKFLLLVLGLLLPIGLFAQVRTDRGYGQTERSKLSRKGSQLSIKYGVKAGVNLSTMSNGMNIDPGFGMGVGYRAGVMANLHWGQRTSNSLPGTGWFGLQPELMYSCQTVKSVDGHIKMSYIQLPIMFKIYPLSALSVEIGPEFNYLFSINQKDITVAGTSVKIRDYKGFSVSAGVGIGYELPIGLVVGARYSLGFTDLAKNLKWKNNGNIQVTVGWLF